MPDTVRKSLVVIADARCRPCGDISRLERLSFKSDWNWWEEREQLIGFDRYNVQANK